MGSRRRAATPSESEESDSKGGSPSVDSEEGSGSEGETETQSSSGSEDGLAGKAHHADVNFVAVSRVRNAVTLIRSVPWVEVPMKASLELQVEGLISWKKRFLKVSSSTAGSGIEFQFLKVEDPDEEGFFGAVFKGDGGVDQELEWWKKLTEERHVKACKETVHVDDMTEIRHTRNSGRKLADVTFDIVTKEGSFLVKASSHAAKAVLMEGISSIIAASRVAGREAAQGVSERFAVKRGGLT